MTLSGLKVKECIMNSNSQYEEKHTDTSQNEAFNNTLNNWQIGAHVTIFRIDGEISHGIITGPGIVTET